MHIKKENHTTAQLVSSQRRWLNGWRSSSTSWRTCRGETLITHLLTFPLTYEMRARFIFSQHREYMYTQGSF